MVKWMKCCHTGCCYSGEVVVEIHVDTGDDLLTISKIYIGPFATRRRGTRLVVIIADYSNKWIDANALLDHKAPI